jgi:tetratricopeptide (TPR) repeat protein
LAALPGIERYAAAHWWHEDAWMTLGLLRVAAGDAQAGIEALHHAGRLDIYNPKPFANIALIELTRNRPAAACEAQQIAVARDPDQPSRYLILAELLERLGRKEAAEAALRRADELRASVRPRAS